MNVADAITIEHNRIYDNAWWTVFGTSGIGMYHLTDATGASTRNGYRNFIVSNLSYGNRNNVLFLAGHPPAIYDGNGIIVDDSLHTQDALGVHDVKGVPYTGRTYIANNITHDNGGRGIHLYRSAHVDVVNNTAWNDMLSLSEYILSGEIDALDSKDVNVVNNIAANLVGKDVTFADGNRYDYNLWQGKKYRARGRTISSETRSWWIRRTGTRATSRVAGGPFRYHDAGARRRLLRNRTPGGRDRPRRRPGQPLRSGSLTRARMGR